MNTPTKTQCSTCARFARREGDRLAAVSEFGNCALLPAWHYVSPHRACRFDPSIWERRK